MVNDTDLEATYKFVVKDIEHIKNGVEVWETRGSSEGEEYDANFYKHIEDITPEYNEEDGTYSLEVTIKPRSMVSLATSKVNPNTGKRGVYWMLENMVDCYMKTILSMQIMRWMKMVWIM